VTSARSFSVSGNSLAIFSEGRGESAARQAALEAPVHAMILWRCVERMLRRTPLRLRSTRFDELMNRAGFMRAEVEPKAREVYAKRAS